MFDPQADPLGIAVQQRARDARWQNIFNGLNSPLGPLPDQNWEGYNQAVEETAGGKHVRYGVSPDQETTSPKDVGLDPNDSTPLSIQMLSPSYSNQLGTKLLVNKKSRFNPNDPDPSSQTT